MLSEELREQLDAINEKAYLVFARFHAREQRFDLAEKLLLTRVESIRKRLGPRHSDVESTLFELCLVFDKAGSVEKLDKYGRECLAILSDCRTNQDCRWDFFDTEGLLGAMHHAHKDYSRAKSLLEDVVTQPILNVRPKTMLVCMQIYPDVLFKTGHRLKGALAVIRATRYEYRQRYPADSLKKKRWVTLNLTDSPGADTPP